MKRVFKFFGIVVVGLIITKNVSAQARFVPDFGSNVPQCQRNLSLFQSDYQIKNFDDAIVHWRKLWRDCPLSSPNLTLRGAEIYRFYIDRELNQARKSALVDTLMQVWEKGIALRPEVASYPEGFAQDMQRYASDDQDKMLKMYEDLMEQQQERTSANTFAQYMNIIFQQNREGRLSDEDLLDNYNKVNDNITIAINKTTNEKMAEELARARDMFEETFANSTAASCENLIKIYGDKYEENKDDAEFLRKLNRMLTRKDCTDSELYEKAAEQQFALNPSSDAAYSMAMLFLRRENFEKVVEYFEHAIAKETNSYDKARYNFLLGNIMLAKYSRFNDAKRYAKEASRLRPDWGEPYILLAQTYAAGPRCGEHVFDQHQVFWVAVDLLQRARSVDSDVASKVNPLIASYTSLFPKGEEGFFRGLTEGTSITVGCWIGETTRVRYNK